MLRVLHHMTYFNTKSAAQALADTLAAQDAGEFDDEAGALTWMRERLNADAKPEQGGLTDER